ncbi:uncharacterized protein PAC_08078 [Phialocephala subalpina]|uniref:Benzoate 4-monooxygenase cytochrome P450 n=1 Tax=Phialocephala subalpina TaxID=576137 RepID=A0A1L7WZL3_9HELO|nr:uncharacterized protein PAC_08078 [Phialocephala subalpina]
MTPHSFHFSDVWYQIRGCRNNIAVAIAFFALIYVGTIIFWYLFFHPLAHVPGPFLAKVLPQYLSPATIRGDRAQTLLALHQKYGPVVRVSPDEVSVGDYKYYREIYSQKASIKDEAFYASGTFLVGHENIFSMRDKTQHSSRRKMQSTSYSQQAILESGSLVGDKADILVRRMKAAALTDPLGQVNAYHLCGLFSFEVICKIGFAKDFGGNVDGESSKLLKSMDESAKVLPLTVIFPFLKTWGIGKYIPGFVGSVFGSFEYWKLKTREIVQTFTEESPEGFIFSPLVTIVDQSLGRRLTEDERVEEALGLMFAGSGTTSSTLTYLLFALSLPESQEYQRRLRDEVREAPDNYQDIKDLPFLNAVIKETMRLYPTIISTLPRVLTTELLVSNYVLPQGTRIGMQNYVHHRDPAVFPKPDKFLPDRWMDATKEMEAALTPFSLGPRNCIGQNLARAELYEATNKIFRQLEVRLDPSMRREDMHMEDRFNIAPRSRKLIVQIKALQ